jgi:hypothetical protein
MSVSGTTSFASSSVDLPDSIFHWIFEAASGNSWGGWLVLDSEAAAAGDTVQGANGHYTLLSETEYGVDLSSAGLEDSEVHVEWYRVGSSGTFLATRNGPDAISGTAGLGSELDAAWTGTDWTQFGLGGLYQAYVSGAPDPDAPAGSPRSDFDGDGSCEVLLRGAGGEVAFWQTDGERITGGVTLLNVGSYWNVVGTGDFNGDGRSDILFKGAGGEVHLWQMDGARILAGTTLLNVGSYWNVVGTGDFNGDGRSDILFKGAGGEVHLWQMDGTRILAATTLANVGSDWNVVGTGDFNGDGRSDILLSGSGGDIAMWEMDGSHIAARTTLATASDYWLPALY